MLVGPDTRVPEYAETEQRMSRDALLSAMRNPAFFGLPSTAKVEVRETHTSTVFLAGDRAYKLKKPVRLPFLDYGTLECRRELCAEEVRVNRRFAPDIYLGVRAIVPDEEGFSLAGAHSANAVEWAVEMRRFDETRTFGRLLVSGTADERLTERVGLRIAELHAASPPARGGGVAEIARWIRDNFEALRAHSHVLDSSLLDAVSAYGEAFLTANEGLFSGRAAAGQVRDVHGDLRAEHVVVQNGLFFVDAVEFDARLRQIDVAADLAFTVMDLERLGAPDLAQTLVDSYVQGSDDRDVRTLVPFYASYRACVRAKVACVRLDQLDPGAPERRAFEAEVRFLLELALRFAWRSRLPLALVVCGLAGSGKSTIALELERRTGLQRLSSDAVRKELAGLAPEHRGGSELYSAEHTTHTYVELARRAAVAVRSKDGVIVDATFHRRDQRRLLADALTGTGAGVLYCECRAPKQTLLNRAGGRERSPEHGSDATPQVVVLQCRSFELFDEVSPADHVAIDTDCPVAESLAELEARVSDAIDRVPRSRRSYAGSR